MRHISESNKVDPHQMERVVSSLHLLPLIGQAASPGRHLQIIFVSIRHEQFYCSDIVYCIIALFGNIVISLAISKYFW